MTRSLDWRAWVRALGPGAIVASLTIGTGELVFSSRAGALFGYRVLGVFALVLLLKWALVFASARYWVYSEQHPMQRWAELPGPRGALPMVLLLLAMPAFPVWVSFHSMTLGSMLAALTDTRAGLGGHAPLVWAIGVLVGTQVVSATGGYARQEKLQTVVIAAMLTSVIIGLVLLRPDWGELVGGFFHIGALRYPDWAGGLPSLSERPVWVEIATYAGVVGGSGYDYLAYVGWLRDKHGVGSSRGLAPQVLSRLVLADGVVSFLMVLVFSSVFVACGAILLGPRHEIPAGSDLLTLQSQFVAVVGPWLKPLYFVGAFLALGGTLYGTIEVAPAVGRELVAALVPPGGVVPAEDRVRRLCVGWAGFGALSLLVANLVWRWASGTKEPFDLVWWITPANLVTGVLACGWISGLNLWLYARDRVRVPGLPWALTCLNALGCLFFTGVGLKGAWDQLGLASFAVLVGCAVAGVAGAAWLGRRQRIDSRIPR